MLLRLLVIFCDNVNSILVKRWATHKFQFVITAFTCLNKDVELAASMGHRNLLGWIFNINWDKLNNDLAVFGRVAANDEILISVWAHLPAAMRLFRRQWLSSAHLDAAHDLFANLVEQEHSNL